MFDWLPATLRYEISAINRLHGDHALDRIVGLFDGTASPLAFQGGARIVPGLSSSPWMEITGDLAALSEAMERGHSAIRDEIDSRMRAEIELVPYGDQQNKNWKALFLYKNGVLVEKNAAFFPRTLALLEPHLSNLYMLGELFFSFLESNAHIPAHCDPTNFWVPLHLGLDIPEQCSITVAGEKRSWTEGECLLFDASFEHSARNDSTRRRVVLIAEVWNPGLTPPEREAIGKIFSYLFQAMNP